MRSDPDPADRVAAARERCTGQLQQRFEQAGLGYPAASVLLRACKHERTLEVWAAGEPVDGEFRCVGEYPILGAAGILGPKRREGDEQVPEGFYRVTRFNPCSRFHLSLGLDYPNAADQLATTHPAAPGSDIFIHGGTESRGCLAMGDPAIEEVYLLARDAGAVAIHLFPCRMDERGWREVLSPLAIGNAGLAEFWRSLQPGYQSFETHHRLPPVEVDESGRYVLRGG